MSQAHDFFRQNENVNSSIKNLIMDTIHSFDKTKPLSISISNIRGCTFFPWHCNRYEGWFIDVNYHNLPTETWFVVEIDGFNFSYDNQGFDLERIS